MLQVYFVSDHTGVTAEMLGRSLLSRFDELEARLVTRSFIDSVDKARVLVAEINRSEHQALVVSSISLVEVRAEIEQSGALVLDLFGAFLDQLASFLKRDPHQRVGSLHGLKNIARYQERIDAVEFAVGTDDGLGTKYYDRADVILVGISRVGKTPTCLYLAMHYGLYAANYPLADEDFERHDLPVPLQPHRERLYGLTIDPLRLQQIREARRGGGEYASLPRCRFEVARSEALFRQLGLAHTNTTVVSVEEIAAGLMQDDRLELRRGRTREL
ncbi:MAG: pyruvate, phosphate dikinase/phosphoenolpyruvate synthase regulator [Trueperaceae bacterium]